MDDTDRGADFTAYVRARGQYLARLAYLLSGTGTPPTTCCRTRSAKVYRNWHRVAGVELPDAYVRRIMVNENNSLWRRFSAASSHRAVTSSR